MKKIFRRAFLLIFWIVSFGFTQTPGNFQDFRNNVRRLFKDKEYDYLADYFKSFAQEFKNRDDLVKLGFSVAMYVPEREPKERLFSYLVDLVNPKNPLKDKLYLQYGLLEYAGERWVEAIKSFSISRDPLSDYYSAFAYYHLGEYENSLKEIETSRKKIGVLKNAAYYDERLKLLEINNLIAQKKYIPAYRVSVKINSEVERLMQMHRILGYTQESQKQMEITKKLLKKYANMERVKNYLKKD